jgi:hypothetical protein
MGPEALDSCMPWSSEGGRQTTSCSFTGASDAVVWIPVKGAISLSGSRIDSIKTPQFRKPCKYSASTTTPPLSTLATIVVATPPSTKHLVMADLEKTTVALHLIIRKSLARAPNDPAREEAGLRALSKRAATMFGCGREMIWTSWH